MFHSMGSNELDDWHYFELLRDHDSMITAPEELPGLLLKIINVDQWVFISCLQDVKLRRGQAC